MAVNKLLPFANGVGANVVDYATWSSLSTLLGQGFVTGVARSDYANRVFAQGALASYILGQFVVDQTAQDADLNETTFYTNFKNALKAYVESNAVALNGAQTVGGVKTFTSSPVVPTATAGDNTQKAASTAFVKKAIDDSVNNVKAVSYDVQTLTDPEKAQARANISAADASAVVDKTTNQTVGGVKTFSDSPIIPTATAGDNSQKAASTAFVKKAVDDSVADVGAVSYKVQTLTESEQTQARTNIGAAKESEVVKIVAQTLTEAEKAQVRANIDAADASDVVHLTGSESVSGVKTFSASPRVPSIGNVDDFTTKAANTRFVKTAVRHAVDELQKQINALEGTVLTATEDSTTAYTKAIPTSANLFKYAAIRNYGGRSIVWNQLWRMYPAADLSKNRCSVVLADGVYTATCTSDQYTYWGFYRNNLRNIVGHKYLYLCEFRVNVQTLPVNFEMRPTAGYVTASASDTWIQFQKIYTEAGSSPVVNFTLSGQAAAVGDEFSVRNPMMIDLTLMFGSGNEPSSVAEFQQMFTDAYYAYSAGEIKSAGVNKIVSKDSNSDVLAEMNIPAEILALPGYGLSAESAYNEIDWERKVYIQRVAQVDLGDLEWYDKTSSYGDYFQSSGLIPHAKTNSKDVCSAYSSSTIWFIRNTAVDKAVGCEDGIVAVRDSSFSDVTTFAASLAGVKLNYELATPIETDISALIDENTIEVESGGSITFENTNGDDYRIPVPSSVVTMEKP